MARGNPKPTNGFKKGDPRINRKGRPPAGLSSAEMCRAVMKTRLEAPFNKGDKQTALELLADKMLTLAIENGDANAYNAILKMLGAFNHEVKMSGEGISIVYLDKQDELL